jgi:hypothetical protein
MAIPLIIMGVAAAVAAACTAIGAAIAQGNLDKAKSIREKILDEYGDDIMPNLDKAIAEEVGPTALAKIQTDPQLREQQTGVMKKLADLYESGGMSEADESALALANHGAQQRADSDYQSLNQNLAARGQTMNPALAAAMAAKSSGAVVDATARNRQQAQADARARAYSALRDSGAMATTIRGQDFSEQATVASAQDAINQFNAGQRTAANNENARREIVRSQAAMALANARGGARENIARGEENQAAATRATAAGLANAASSVGGAAAGYAGGGSAPVGGAKGSAGSAVGSAPISSIPDYWEDPYKNGGRA